MLAILSLALIAAVSATPAHAEDQTHIAEYKLYTEALARDDQAAAAQHGRAAWQAAETALGDDSLTAILAYNYGQLVMFSDPAQALAALRRADELHKAGVTELPASELRLYLAFAAFADGKQKRREAKELRQALLAIDAEQPAPTIDLLKMWLALANSDLTAKRYKETVQSAAYAEKMIAAIDPENYQVRASTILLGGVAKLVPYPRKVAAIQAAHNDFARARNLFPRQKDLDSFDSTLADIIAWDAAARAALYSKGEKDFPDHERHEQDVPPSSYGPLFQEERNSDEECGIEWDKRPPPDYPFQAEINGYIGAAVVGFRFGDDLKIHDQRILSEVPHNTFSNAILKSIRKWRLKVPPPDDPACRNNFITQFTFVIEE